MKIVVQHWRYDDGWHDIPFALRFKREDGCSREFLIETVGWHCWVYTTDDREFEEWMRTNMRYGYNCTLRFNSGNPMYTVHIAEPEDATIFKLKWL